MTSSLLLNWLFLFDKLCFCSVFFQNKSTQSLLVIRHIFRELNRRPADDDDDGDDEDYQHQSGFKKIKTLRLFVFFGSCKTPQTLLHFPQSTTAGVLYPWQRKSPITPKGERQEQCQCFTSSSSSSSSSSQLHGGISSPNLAQ